MKRILIISLSIVLLSTGVVFAKNKKTSMPVIKFNDAKFSLYYSAKSKETGGYINEYYKPNETYTSWTELIGLHHYPISFYPIEHAKEFQEYLNSKGSSAIVEFDNENNAAILYFVIIDNHKLPIIMEFNIFKYVKSPVCGTIGIQYAKRYRAKSALEIDNIQKKLVKEGTKNIKKFSKLDIPDIVTVEIDKGKYVLKEGHTSNDEILE